MEMRKRFLKTLLLLFFVSILALSNGCTINNDPSLVVRDYLNCLKEGDCQKAASYTEKGEALTGEPDEIVLLKRLFAESIYQRPMNHLQKEDEAFVRFQIIMPDITTFEQQNSSQTISYSDLTYTKLIAEIRLVKSDGVWKISEESNPLNEQLLKKS